MTPIASRLAACRIGTPVVHRSLSVVPLYADASVALAPYLLLDDAIASGLAQVTEVSSGGSVPELALWNLADQPVLVLDGEELVGAKQNRILNLSVLAPAKRATVIPVSCVEAGRWHAVSARFASGARTHFASGRARQAADVSASMRDSGQRRGDQHAVWREIAEKSARMGVRSATGAAAALYEDRRDALEGFVRALAARPAQCGAVFAIDGRPAGVELFDRPDTFAKALPKLVRGYALDALDAGRSEAGASADETVPPAMRGARGPGLGRAGTGRAGSAAAAPAPSVEVLDFLARVARAAATTHAAVGIGEDWRLDHAAVAGGALVHEDRVVHLCAFPVADGWARPRERVM